MSNQLIRNLHAFEMNKQSFVGREKPLSILKGCLEKAFKGQGSVIFISGEAGVGKTELAKEFFCQAQKVNPNLVVAIGRCDSQTGLGDAYLPFREIMHLLVGDVESISGKGLVSSENAERLKRLCNHSGKTLVEWGPTLIDIFVPGTSLMFLASKLVAKKVGWVDRLKKMVEEKKREEKQVDQNRLFEQYALVLSKLAENSPLALLLDDLQWADTASLGMLFHLGRRISQSPIHILGTYRPNDVRMGRGGERHPLLPVLNELKRYYGPSEINLDAFAQEESAHFVRDYLEQNYSPSIFDDEFKGLISRCTRANALFTGELMKEMEAKGWISLNDRGEWQQAQPVIFKELPAKVEAVIEERIDRLPEELQEVLAVASVEGEGFTAQVIARVVGLDEDKVLDLLAKELEQKHRLVFEEEELGLEGGFLSLYRFQHCLFQQYLYNRLGKAQKSRLHAKVGTTLETLYGQQSKQIAIKLARHFLEANHFGKAVAYHLEAGNQALRTYAAQEAIDLYTKALGIAPKVPDQIGEEIIMSIHENKGQALILLSRYKEAAEEFQAVLDVATKMGDRGKEGEALYNLAWTHYWRQTERDDEQAWEYASRAHAIATETDNKTVLAKSLNIIGSVYQSKGELKQASSSHQEALKISQEIGDKPTMATCLLWLGMQANWQGRFDQAISYGREGLELSQEIYDGLLILRNLHLLGLACCGKGRYEEALEYFQQGLRRSKEFNNRLMMATFPNDLGWLYGELGDFEQALQFDQEGVKIAREFGVANPEISSLINVGVDYLHQEEYGLSLQYLEPALSRVEREGVGTHRWRWKTRLFEGLGAVWLAKGDYGKAADFCEQGFHLARLTGAQKYLAKLGKLKGEIHVRQGQLEAAGNEFKKALDLAETIGYLPLLWQGHYVMGQLYRKQGKPQEAEAEHKKAKEIIEERVASWLSNSELRASFLRAISVQQIYQP